MSAKLMGQIWDLDLDHSEQLVLLALADHADHEGKNIYPSIGLIAWKTGYSERQIHRIYRALEDKKVLCIQQERPGQPTIYYLDLSPLSRKKAYQPKRSYAPATPDKMAEVENVTPDIAMSYPPLTQSCHTTPDIAMSYKPSLNHQLNQEVVVNTQAVQDQQTTAAALSDLKNHPRVQAYLRTFPGERPTRVFMTALVEEFTNEAALNAAWKLIKQRNWNAANLDTLRGRYGHACNELALQEEPPPEQKKPREFSIEAINNARRTLNLPPLPTPQPVRRTG